MKKSKFKLQPITVRNPSLGGTVAPLPLPHDELLKRINDNGITSIRAEDTYTGITDISDTTLPNRPLEEEQQPEINVDKFIDLSERKNSLSAHQEAVKVEITGETTTSKRTEFRLNSAGSDKGEQIGGGKRGRKDIGVPELPGFLKGKVREVWKFLREEAIRNQRAKDEGLIVRATRGEIARRTGIGSLDTIDRSVSRLQGLGFIEIHRAQGVNEGNVYEIKEPETFPKNQETAWQRIVEILQSSAEVIKEKGDTLNADELIQWSQLGDRAKRLLDQHE